MILLLRWSVLVDTKYISVMLYLFPYFLPIDKFCLVLWPEENSVSVLCLERVVEGSKVGDRYRVKIQRKIHEGKILAIGKLNLFTLCA